MEVKTLLARYYLVPVQGERKLESAPRVVYRCGKFVVHTFSVQKKSPQGTFRKSLQALFLSGAQERTRTSTRLTRTRT